MCARELLLCALLFGGIVHMLKLHSCTLYINIYVRVKVYTYIYHIHKHINVRIFRIKPHIMALRFDNINLNCVTSA